MRAELASRRSRIDPASRDCLKAEPMTLMRVLANDS
jgi:hypothetical protein